MESGSRTAKSLEKYWKAWTNINLLKTFILQVKPYRFLCLNFANRHIFNRKEAAGV